MKVHISYKGYFSILKLKKAQYIDWVYAKKAKNDEKWIRCLPLI
jgi:hypothetical protein